MQNAARLVNVLSALATSALQDTGHVGETTSRL
jgi:hypothetical protein